MKKCSASSCVRAKRYAGDSQPDFVTSLISLIPRSVCLLAPALQKHTNGVIWYIVGVIFVLALYPLDLAVLSILM
jgi:dolichol kinase